MNPFRLCITRLWAGTVSAGMKSVVNCPNIAISSAILNWCNRLLSPIVSRSGLGPHIREAQSSRRLDLWQDCHEIAKKSSKIVPLGAPFLRGSVNSADTLSRSGQNGQTRRGIPWIRSSNGKSTHRKPAVRPKMSKAIFPAKYVTVSR
jgi:hypothetical protein